MQDNKETIHVTSQSLKAILMFFIEMASSVYSSSKSNNTITKLADYMKKILRLKYRLCALK